VSKPNTPLPIRQISPAHAGAHARFLAVLVEHAEAGAMIPCLSSAGDWVSENRDAQAAAAAACSPCPALIRCRVYGRHWERHGVYGGISAADRAQERTGARPVS
jgi:hypothetical protein